MKKSITININPWIVVVVLLLTNVLSLALWQPWIARNSDRKIVITGSTTIEAEADQYTFTPYYQKTGTDRTKINNELINLSKTIVAKLKTLGVNDSSIKTDVSSYDYGIYYYDDSKTVSGTLSVTVTVKNDKTLAQKVQDYLVTTSASGSVTPQITFSLSKQKELETQARSEALSNARTKAEDSAKQLGATLGQVLSVGDAYNGGVTPLPWLVDSGYKSGSDSVTEPSSDTSSSYAIQPGLNEYSFSVEVTYELK